MPKSTPLYRMSDLLEMQKRTYDRKISVSLKKILEFCVLCDWKVSVSFSGGADSSVLLDLVAQVWRGAKELHGDSALTVIYANTSNEFASMPRHVKGFCEYIEQKHDIAIELKEVRSKTNYFDVCKTVGYPIASKKIARFVEDCRRFFAESLVSYDDIKDKINDGIASAEYLRQLGFPKTIVLRLTSITSENIVAKSYAIPKKWRFLITAPFNVSDKCCNILKKEPLKLSQKASKLNPIFGTLAEDSKLRQSAYLQTGCIAYNGDKGQCTPLGFWLRQNILRYLDDNTIPIAPPLRTAC